MMRTQIQLTPAQHRRLKRWAASLGISLAEAVRRCVEERLDRGDGASSRSELVRQALEIAGRYEDPAKASDVAREHDRHLARAYRR